MTYDIDFSGSVFACKAAGPCKASADYDFALLNRPRRKDNGQPIRPVSRPAPARHQKYCVFFLRLLGFISVTTLLGMIGPSIQKAVKTDHSNFGIEKRFSVVFRSDV